MPSVQVGQATFAHRKRPGHAARYTNGRAWFGNEVDEKKWRRLSINCCGMREQHGELIPAFAATSGSALPVKKRSHQSKRTNHDAGQGSAGTDQLEGLQCDRYVKGNRIVVFQVHEMGLESMQRTQAPVGAIRKETTQ